MIVEIIGEAATYEQLAEEAAELAQAALKMARIIRKENPTPKTDKEAAEEIKEEYTDVLLIAMELGLNADPSQMYRKQRRFIERVKVAERERVQTIKQETAIKETPKEE